MTDTVLPATAGALANTPASMPDAEATPAAPAGPPQAPWRPLARLCRRVERNDPAWQALLGPHAGPAVQALRRAQAAWRDHRREPAHGHDTPPRPPPIKALHAAATAAARVDQRVKARPAAFFAPAPKPLGTELLLQLPQLKDWLQRDFVREAALPPDAPRESAVARAREVLLRQCLTLSGVGDSLQRRRHLLQLLHDHAYAEPLLHLVRRAGRDWLPRGWAEDWEAIADVDDDRRAVEALKAALGNLVPAVERWCASLKPAAPVPAAPASGLAPSAAPARSPTPGPAHTGQPLILQAARLPRGVLWAVGTTVLLGLGLGLFAHLKGGNGLDDARWAVYHDADGETMAIDPDSIRRDGRQLTYRVGVVWTRENKSAVAVFTADCSTRQRRLETVQHYRGLRFETATRYEVRGTPAGPWPATGVDAALLRAACAQR